MKNSRPTASDTGKNAGFIEKAEKELLLGFLREVIPDTEEAKILYSDITGGDTYSGVILRK